MVVNVDQIPESTAAPGTSCPAESKTDRYTLFIKTFCCVLAAGGGSGMMPLSCWGKGGIDREDGWMFERGTCAVSALQKNRNVPSPPTCPGLVKG